MAVTEKQYAKIVDMLISQRFARDEIAEETGVSTKTVQRIKNVLKEKASNALTEDGIEALKNNSFKDYITNEEKKYIQKYKKSILEYEDVEEGWCFHIESLREKKRESGTWWMGIVYPESAPENWKERLEATGNPIAISPLHDKDTWNHDSPEVVDPETGEVIYKKGERYKAGDKKKPHWHILIKFQTRVHWEEVNRTFREITNGPYLQKCYSLSGSYFYHTHEHNPEKYHYDNSERIILNNFILEFTKAEQKLFLAEICEYVAEHKELDTFTKVIEAYKGRDEYLMIITAKAYAITQIATDNWRQRHPEGRVRKVRIVNEEE